MTLTMKANEEKEKTVFYGGKIQIITKPHNFYSVIRCEFDTYTHWYTVHSIPHVPYPFTPFDNARVRIKSKNDLDHCIFRILY